MATPSDAKQRKEIRPVICYPNNTLPDPDLSGLNTRSEFMDRVITLNKIMWMAVFMPCLDWNLLGEADCLEQIF